MGGGVGKRGGQLQYSDLAIETALTLRLLFHLPLRQTEGFLTSIITLIEATDGNLSSVTADAAYDTVGFYEAAGARGAAVVVPPTSTANVSRHGPRSSVHDRTIAAVKEMGRRRWKKASGYHRQAHVESAFFRYKSIFGGALRARSPGGQVAEALVACNVLNQMANLGRPDSYAIGR